MTTGPRTGGKRWYSVTVTADISAEDAVENVFAVLDVLSATSHAFGDPNSNLTRITAYFEEEPDIPDIKKRLRSGLSLYGLPETLLKDLESEVVAERDWLAEWKQHWKPTRAGPFLVAPPWAESERNGLIEIRIEPGMAFGTGTHESTRLCLEIIGKYFEPGMSFLDVGTGTGILAIAAAKLAGSGSESQIYGCDTDETAVEIAIVNAADNDAGFIDFEVATVAPTTPVFDFVCANMTIDVIEPMLPELLRVSGNYLVVSGILVEQEGSLRNRLSSIDAGETRVFRENDWIAAIVSR